MPDARFDQAHGLRCLFAPRTVHLLPVAANPAAGHSLALLGGLCRALGLQGLHTLVVDVAATPAAPATHQGSALDLAALVARRLDPAPWIDELDAHTGLLSVAPSLSVFAQSDAAAHLLFETLRDASPSADLMLFHADAALLAGLFARQPVRPLVLGGDDAASLTHAYASIKLLAVRGGLLQHTVLMDMQRPARSMPAPALRLARCVAAFLGGEVELAALSSARCANEDELAAELLPLSQQLMFQALPLTPQGDAAPAAPPSRTPTPRFALSSHAFN